MKGAFIMPHKSKSTPNEKVMLIKKYLAGEISVAEACTIAKIKHQSFRAWLRIYMQEGSSGLINDGHNRKYCKEMKINAVELYLAGEGSLNEICEKYKIRSKTQLLYWIKLYNSGKNLTEIAGGSRMSKPRKTTLEERIKIAKECIEAGHNYKEIAEKYNVGYQQVYIWVKKFVDKGKDGLQDRRGRRKMNQEPRTAEEEAQVRIAKLEHENYLLRMERDLLKKVKELERRDAFRK